MTMKTTGTDLTTDSSPSEEQEEYVLERISYSKASTYKQCPRRWKHDYIDKRKLVTASYAMVLGKFVHFVLEYFYDLPAEFRDVDDLQGLAKLMFPIFLREEPDWELLGLTEEDIKQFKRDAWASLRQIWELENPEDVETISTEQQIDVQFGSIRFVGVIDRVEEIRGKLVIGDYKTGSPPAPRYRQDRLIQVILYSAAAQQIYGQRPEKAKLIFIGKDPKVIQIHPTERMMEREVDALKEIWTSIEMSVILDDFEPKTGPLCGWCPHVDICPEGADEVGRRVMAGKMKPHAPALQILTKEQMGLA